MTKESRVNLFYCFVDKVSGGGKLLPSYANISGKDFYKSWYDLFADNN